MSMLKIHASKPSKVPGEKAFMAGNDHVVTVKSVSYNYGVNTKQQSALNEDADITLLARPRSVGRPASEAVLPVKKCVCCGYSHGMNPPRDLAIHNRH